jgi:hypothetical protein
MTKKRKGFDTERDIKISIGSLSLEESEKKCRAARISHLLRDACPTFFEIEGEKDPAKRRANERARDQATDALIKLYREAERRNGLSELDISVRFFCQDLKARNGGKLPNPKGGRPAEEDRYLRIAFYITEKAEVRGGGHGSVEGALKDAAEHFNLDYKTVRDIYYETRAAEDWPSVVKAERAWRSLRR